MSKLIKYTIPVLLSSLFLFAACKKSTDELLIAAENLLHTNLDSVNIMLERIPHPESLPEKQQTQFNKLKMLYLMSQTTEWEKADSLNNILLEYYTHTSDTTNLIHALFYSSKISIAQNNQTKAIRQLQVASDMAGKKNLPEEQALFVYTISNILFEKKEFGQAIDYANQALIFLEHNDSARISTLYKHIGSSYKQQNKVDSAMYYYNRALYYTENNEDLKYITSYIYNEITDLYLKIKDYKNALHYADLSIQYRTNRKDIPFFNLTKARVFLSTNETDSAKVYLLRTIESSEDDFISITAYNHLIDLYTLSGEYQQAYFKKLTTEKVFNKNEERLSSEVLSRKYMEEKLKNENNQLTLAKREREILLLFIAFIASVVISVLCFFLLEERKKKKLREQQVREQLLEEQAKNMKHENQLLKKENELMLLKEKASVLRESLFKKMSVSEKIPSLDIANNNMKTSSGKIHLTESDWIELIRTTDILFNGFVSRLKKEFPVLSNEDIKFCCLIKIQISMQDLADIYCISKAGITKKKTRMKKEKFKLENENISLDDFLLSIE